MNIRFKGYQEYFNHVVENFKWSKRKEALEDLKAVIEKNNETLLMPNMVANIDRELYEGEKRFKNKQITVFLLVFIPFVFGILIGCQWQFKSSIKTLEKSNKSLTYQIDSARKVVAQKKDYLAIAIEMKQKELVLINKLPKVKSLGVFHITGYCPCKKCTGKDPGDDGYGITNSGAPVEEGVTIGVDPKVIPIGSKIRIEGYPEIFIAQDIGPGIKGNEIDLYRSTHEAANVVGNQFRGIVLIE